MGLTLSTVHSVMIAIFAEYKNAPYIPTTYSGQQSGPKPYTTEDDEAASVPASKSCKGAPQRVIKAMNKFRYLLIHNLAFVVKIRLWFDFAWPSKF